MLRERDRRINWRCSGGGGLGQAMREEGVCLFVCCVFLCQSVGLFICLFVSLLVCLFIYLSVCFFASLEAELDRR